MSILTEARNWFTSNYSLNRSKLYTSKFYLPEESWPKEIVWWLQVPLSVLETKEYDFIDLVCQVESNGNTFHYLKVPVRFFRENIERFHIVDEKISMYLSAEQEKLFVEIRGNGKLSFREFLVSDSI